MQNRAIITIRRMRIRKQTKLQIWGISESKPVYNNDYVSIRKCRMGCMEIIRAGVECARSTIRG